MHASTSFGDCAVRKPAPRQRRERGVLFVVFLTAVMMVAEIAAGYATNSMALLADGWHMATHVGALGIASAAYALARSYAGHRAFAFGTGKVHALAGYTSALALALAAVLMVIESVERLIEAQPIDFAHSLPVAVVGLVVNLISVALLHDHDEHEHARHDHNHRAAFLHVLSDTLTSALAIAALLVGRFVGWLWLDAISGIVGGLVVLRWGAGLCKSSAFELLDVNTNRTLEEKVRDALEAVDDVRVTDLHVWSIGQRARSCVVTVVSAQPREAREYRERLASLELAHLTIEVQRCASSHPHLPNRS
jgi:cation diffusion facilitator family transporter